MCELDCRQASAPSSGAILLGALVLVADTDPFEDTPMFHAFAVACTASLR